MQLTHTAGAAHFHKVADCQWARPAHTPVPEYIRMIGQGRYSDNCMVNSVSNVFPGILGRTCDRPSEPACRRGRVEVGNGGGLPEPAGSFIRTQIPRFRLPEEIIIETGYILDLGVQFKSGQRIDSMQALLTQGFDAIFVGCGPPRGHEVGSSRPGNSSRHGRRRPGIAIWQSERSGKPQGVNPSPARARWRRARAPLAAGPSRQERVKTRLRGQPSCDR